MNFSDVITIDTETLPITDDVAWSPPKPVGVASKEGALESFYGAFGHPAGNNVTYDDAKAYLARAWESGRPLLFHNASYDLKVIHHHFGLPPPHWSRVHDTMFLAYLLDPYAKSTALKPLAESVLGWPPEEQEALHGWLWDHREDVRRASGQTFATKKQAGSVIAWAPGDLVGQYATSDVGMTFALFLEMWPQVEKMGMLPAYDRERQLLPILLENERVGIRVDTGALEKDVALLQAGADAVDAWLRERLNAPSLEMDNDRQVAEVLSREGIVDDDQWVLTESGQRSVSKANLRPGMYNDPAVASAFGYRNRALTSVKMFMVPWLEQGSRRGGYVSTSWNQTRGGQGGTRTGRLSSTKPNFMNLPSEFEGRTDGYVHPDFLNLPRLPNIRGYMLPDEGHVWLKRDYSSQEIRTFAHFEDGPMAAAYRENPKLDPHSFVKAELLRVTGTEFERTKVKIVNFSRLYGAGAPGVAKNLGCSVEEARAIIRFHEQAMPGQRMLNDAIKRRVALGEPIETWGGRLYWAEGADKAYRLLNYLCQGSAADLTKQSIIDWSSHPDRDPDTRMTVTVHDEIALSSPKEVAESQMYVLKEVMEAERLSVPMLSEGSWGWSWGRLEDFVD